MKIFMVLVLMTIAYEVTAQPQMSEACKAAFPKCRDNMQDREKMKQCMEENGCTMPTGGPGPMGHGGAPGGPGGPGSPKPEAKPEVKPETKPATKPPKEEEATGESVSKVDCTQVTDNGRQNPKADLGEKGPSTQNNNSVSGQ